MLRKRHRILYLGEDGVRGHSLLVPVIVTISFLLFVVTMYVNDCPAHSHNCTLSALGRLSFQPLSDNPLFGPSSSALSKMGGISSDTVADKHQLWRPFSCIWLHAGVVHLLVDLISLLFVGIRLEQEFGCVRVGCIYFLSGIGGSLFSLLFIENRVSVGSSGAVFGLIGAIVAEIVPNWSKHEGKSPTFMTLGVIAILLFIIGLFPHIDNFSHAGGFLFGLLLGYVFFAQADFDWSKYQIAPHNRLTDFSTDTNKKMCKMFVCVVVVLLLAILYLIFIVLAFKGVNGNDHCSWCRSFSCIPSSHWNCGGDSKSHAVCKYMIRGTTMWLTCEVNQRSQTYSGIFALSSIKQFCAELCS
ncbi:hypothetical protein GOP47_0017427 [Adiantum capillus-veneris]|uniref:RHOMBOID-like protein n=1 Tax=Adiantum capillus-veneris TaxID=13818 RepID=A0A9D4UGD4_ADICA|nr:hypothetical protein GOP47_0017427 [Adiantum capillus-veneris]